MSEFWHRSNRFVATCLYTNAMFALVGTFPGRTSTKTSTVWTSSETKVRKKYNGNRNKLEKYTKNTKFAEPTARGVLDPLSTRLCLFLFENN